MEHSRLKVLIYHDKFLQGFHILKCTVKSLDGPRSKLGVPGCEQLVSVPHTCASMGPPPLWASGDCCSRSTSAAPRPVAVRGARGEQEASTCFATFAAHLEPLREPDHLRQNSGGGMGSVAAPQVFQSPATTLVPSRPRGL